jgi:hypothetical protein
MVRLGSKRRFSGQKNFLFNINNTQPKSRNKNDTWKHSSPSEKHLSNGFPKAIQILKEIKKKTT